MGGKPPGGQSARRLPIDRNMHTCATWLGTATSAAVGGKTPSAWAIGTPMWLKGNLVFFLPNPYLCSSGDLKTSQQVAANIAKYKLFEDLINVEPEAIGADWVNRMGSTPNITVCHQVLPESFKKDGYEPSKPQFGLCRSFAGNQELREKLRAWNHALSRGDSRYPRVSNEKMVTGPLPCTHLNITARMFLQEITTCQGLWCKSEENKSLDELTRLGHNWHVLSHETPDDVAAEASAWLGTSQVSHVIEHVRCLQRTCKKELSNSRMVVLANVVAKTMDQFKLKSQVLLHLARWVCSQGPYEFVDALCHFHSTEENPNVLTVNPSLFGEVAQLMPKPATNVELDLVTLAYNDKNKIAKVRPQPDVADFIKVGHATHSQNPKIPSLKHTHRKAKGHGTNAQTNTCKHRHHDARQTQVINATQIRNTH